MNTSIAVLGPGSVGGTLASVFWKAGISVTCVGRPEHSAAIAEKGINFESSIFGNYVAHPNAVERLTSPHDIIFITTKAPHLRDALERIAPAAAARSVVIPLLNGLSHVAQIRGCLGSRVAAGSISIEALRTPNGAVIHRSPFADIRIASDHDIAAFQLETARSLITSSGIGCEIAPSEADVLWKKLVRLNALALATAAYNRTIGELRSDPTARNTIQSCVEEGCAVAEREGVVCDPRVVMDEIDALGAAQRSSLARDVAAGKESELDAIAGAIVERGARHNIQCPTIRSLIMIIVSQ